MGRPRWYLRLMLWAILGALLVIAAIDSYGMISPIVTRSQTKIGTVLGINLEDAVNWFGCELAGIPLQVVAVLLLNLRPARIANLANSSSGRKVLLLAKVILALWLASDMALAGKRTTSTTMSYFSYMVNSLTIFLLSVSSLQTTADSHYGRWVDIVLHVCYLGDILTTFSRMNSVKTFVAMILVLFMGNLQMPAAVAQVVLSSLRLHSLAHHVYLKENKNLVPSIVVFYVLELCQGTFYNVACILEIFSFFVRRSLARHSGFRGQWGVRAVDLYYQRVYTTCMETGVLAPGNMISLASFAIKSLSSSSHELQLAGVRVLDSLLQRRDYSKELISQVTKSSKAVSILTSMLGWKDVQDKHTRLFAARIIAELAGSLRIAVVPGMLSLVSSLLDADKQAKQGSLCLLSYGSGNNNGMNMGDSPSSGRNSSAHSSGGNEIGDDTKNEPSIQIVQDCLSQAVRDNEENILGNQLPEQESSGQPDHGNGGHAGNRPMRYQLMFTREGNAGWRYWLHLKQRWRPIKEKWSIPKELPVTHQDSFPVLGMLILERLAYDLDNCAEIGRATDLISNIIAFISYRTITSNSDDEQQKTMACLSLNLVRRLANTGEKIGSKLRQELWDNPLLLRKFAGTLEDSHSGPEILEPAMDIIAKLAWDEEARQEIGGSQVIIGKLVHAFLGREHTNMYHDQPVRMVAGEALANLAIGSTVNCRAILKEQRYDIIKELKNMLYNIDYQYIAASLLQNLCAHCIDELQRPSSREQLSSAFPMVIGTIISTEGKQLEVLIGLASQMCNIIPELPNVLGMQSQVDVTAFVHKMVRTLHENMIPSPEYPRMRRVTLEMAISILEECPCYATIFREKGMIYMLSKIEMTTQSKVEKYRVFFGNVGVVLETDVPLPVLVSKAKGLIGSL
ncbi:unnamed protein product [Urochloa humidicola]